MRVLSAGGRCALLAVGPPRRRGERVRRGPAHGTTPARPSTIDGFSRVPSLSFRKQRWILVLAFSSFPAMGSMPLPPFCPILVSMSERKESTSRLGPGLPFKVGSGLRELATGSFRSTMPPGTDCRTPATPRKSCANSPQRVRPGTAHPSEPTPPSAAASVSASPTACAVAPDPRAAPMSAEQPMFLHEGLSPNFICGGTRPTAELSLSLSAKADSEGVQQANMAGEAARGAPAPTSPASSSSAADGSPSQPRSSAHAASAMVHHPRLVCRRCSPALSIC